MDRTCFRRHDGALHCESVALLDVAATVGTPAYVYSRQALLDRYTTLDAAFAGIDHLICYSVKANSNLAVLRLLAGAGAGADVVSGGELDRALRAGVPPERIVFSGVGKTAEEIGEALDAGILSIHCESAAELDLIESLARSRSCIAAVSVRVNPDIEAGGHDYIETGHQRTKFGLPVPESRALYRRIAASPHLEAIGIDMHIGSQILSAKPFAAAVRVLRSLVEELRDLGVTLRLIDVGGGFGITYDGEVPETAAGFAAALRSPLEDLGTRLVLEPGRFVAGNAGVLLTRVVRVKQNGDRTFVIADAGMNDLIRPSLYGATHTVEPVVSRGQTTIIADLVGPICETGDWIARELRIETPQAGDLLAVGSAGAYGATMASNYNSRPRAPEVMVEGESFRVVRRRETREDLLRAELDLG